MKINKENAVKLWNETIGKDKQSTCDFAGRKINKASYDKNSKYGWNIDHKLALSKGGTNDKGNLLIVHHKTNSEKGNKTTFKTNGKIFQVKKVKSKNYKIIEMRSKNEDK